MRRAKLGSIVGALFLVAGCGTDASQGASAETLTADAGSGTDASQAGKTETPTTDAGSDAGGADSGSSDACKNGETQSCYGGPSGTQGVGPCVAGTRTCADGVFGACVGDVTPAAEACDGLDNDCDGTVDNGNPGGGQACITGLLGVCAVGITACTASGVVCNQGFAPSPETCDGLDNDCNGTVDEGNPGAGQPCSTGLQGVCGVGATTCTNGSLACNQTVTPSAESCDTLDNDCDGTPDNGVCAPGHALSFDGVDDRVTMTVPSLFNDLGTSDFTIEAWVYPTSSVFARIVFAQGSLTSFAALTRGSSGEVYFYVFDNNAFAPNNKTEAGALPLNQWTHVAATFATASNTIAVYINGVAQTLSAGGSSSTGTNGVMTIGSRTNGGQHFEGMIDEVRIWNVARPGCEIAAAYACEMPLDESGLVASYHFDQGTAGGSNPGVTTLDDSAAAGNDGTLSGFALSGTTSNWVSAGGGVGGGLTGVVCKDSGCGP